MSDEAALREQRSGLERSLRFIQLMTWRRLQPMHRQVFLLATGQAFAQTVSTLIVTVGSLAGSQIAPVPYLATAPIASMFLGTAVATVPASLWMARAGRRAGFVAGALLGAAGGLVAALGLSTSSLLVLSLGTFLVGAYQGFAQFHRFAASEIADDAFRPRAISLVLTGGVVAAVLGPALGNHGESILETAHLGSFLILALLSLAAAAVLMRLRVPPPRHEAGKPRPILTIMRQPNYSVALFVAASGSGVMVLAMTATPLAMAAHHHGLADTTTVIQVHVLGMFVPSFFTGSLTARFGVLPIMVAGIVVLIGYVALALTGTGLTSFVLALAALGVGWNFLYVGGTTLLTGAYRPVERARAQAANDLTIFVVALLASLGAGVLLQAIGWRLTNLILVPWLMLALGATLWLGWSRRGST